MIELENEIHLNRINKQNNLQNRSARYTDLNNRLSQSRGGTLTCLEFTFFLKEFPACVAPIDSAQTDIRKLILGENHGFRIYYFLH